MSSGVVQSGHWHPASRPNDPDGHVHQEQDQDQDQDQEHETGGSIPSSADNHASDVDAILPVNDSADHHFPQSVTAPDAHPHPHAPEIRLPPLPSLTTMTPASPLKGPSNDAEMPDDDDEERLDPAWGFSRSNTEHFLSAANNRSTSFPIASPSADHAQYAPPQQDDNEGLPDQPDAEDPFNIVAQKYAERPLPFSQLESLQMNTETEDTKDTKDTKDTEDKADGIMGQSNLNNPLVDMDSPSKARFDEGLPLMAPDDPHIPTQDEDSLPQTLPPSVAFADDDETSFFNHVEQADDQIHLPPVLERKSTSAVLAALPRKPQDIEPSIVQPDISDAFLPGADPDEDVSFFSKPAGLTQPVDETESEDVWKAVMDADDEFLVEDPDDLLPDTDSDPGSPSSFNAMLQESIPSQQNTRTSPRQGISASQRTPPSANRPGFHQRQSSSNPYAPHQPSTSELSQLSPTTHGNVGLSRPGLAPLNSYSFQSQLQQRPPAPQSAESFADQAKGGYKSPYDLPTELSKPRKRAHLPQIVPTTKAVAPPPRSSSMTDKQLQSPFTPTTTAFPNSTIAPPIQSPHQVTSVSNPSIAPTTRPKTKGSTSSFFEELPITSKPRGVSGHGRFTPQQTNAPPVPQLPPQSPPQQKALPPQPQPSPPRQADPYAQFQLRQPDRLDPFSNNPLQPQSVPVASAPANSRYSPAPPNPTNLARTGPSPRYSPAPPSQASAAPPLNRYASLPQVPQVPQAGQPQNAPVNRYVSQPPPSQPPMAQYPFAPRTSSPLVHHKASVDEGSVVANSGAMNQLPMQQQLYQSQTTSVPGMSPIYNSPSKVQPPPATMAPPRRSQTQSPSKQHPRPTLPMPSGDVLNRPASAHGQMSPVRAHAHMDLAPRSRPFVQNRGIVDELDFIQPTDETIADPLQRWKGAPVFFFGFGGTIVTTFPKHVPRYAQGFLRPQIKPTVGDLSVRNLKDILPLPEHIATFPGPLRNKSKKKDVLNWLNASIARLESGASAVSYITQPSSDSRKSHEEKLLLWKIIRSLVEHDGVLDINPDALKSVNTVLAPEVHAVDEATATQYKAEDIMSGIYRPSGASARSDAVDPMAIETLRKHLLRGARQDAVWHAVDHRLWSHALLIASTLPPDVWGQVVHEFVKQEVKPAGANTESLSTLYEIFGGNKDDCIDQLVPPSARAGLQMVSKAEEHSKPNRNALDGLDRWRETLTLVINNRSQGDYQALATLGRLLGDYGRIEAAHICFLFSRNPANPVILGGSDDPQASLTLLGADNRKYPHDFARDHESILLTEVYEYATLVLGNNPAVPFLPYLSPYKLQRAVLLTEEGFKSEAQAYCDALMASVNRSTKTLPYYHRAFLGELDDFQNRLKQVPIQTAGSWTKPNLEKVSNSLLGRLSSFVAGDDSDAESKGSGKDVAEAGPFANVAGTPSLSRTGSQSDIYGSYPSASLPNIPATIAGSRYAPNGLTSNRSSSELTRGRPSLDSQRSPPHSSHARSPYDPTSMLHQAQSSLPTNPYQPFGVSSPTNRYQATPPQSSYMSQAPMTAQVPVMQEAYIPTPPPEGQYHPQDLQEPIPSEIPAYTHTPYEQPSYGGFIPSPQPDATDSNAYEPPAQSFGYDPPTDMGYVPYTPEPDSPEMSKSKKKSFMNDDDEDDYPRPSNPTPTAASSAPQPTPSSSGPDPAIAAAVAEQERLDAEAKAADKAAKKQSGWFGGLWGGAAKKSDSLDGATPSSSNKGSSGSAEPKVYRANLGESKMKLFYDKDLKKWVNPDNPDAGVKAGPVAPPPRAASAMGAPPMMGGGAGGMGPPRAASSMMPPPTPGLPTNMGMGMGGSPMTGSGPSSRQGTPLNGTSGGASFGSSVLPPATQAGLGLGAGAGAGLGVGGPPSRPGTAMSNASSIDDLLGPGPVGGGRKSVKGKKGGKGGRYVDVMAK